MDGEPAFVLQPKPPDAGGDFVGRPGHNLLPVGSRALITQHLVRGALPALIPTEGEGQRNKEEPGEETRVHSCEGSDSSWYRRAAVTLEEAGSLFQNCI